MTFLYKISKKPHFLLNIFIVFFMSLLIPYPALRADGDNEIEVQGFIQSLTENSLTVNNLVFSVDINTKVQGEHGTNLSFADLKAGDFVEIKALVQSDGSFLATHIKLKNRGNELEVKGFIEAIGQDSLVVNQLVFFTDSTTKILGREKEPLTLSDLQKGDFVEIKAIIQSDGTFLAQWIKLENDENEVEVKGVVEKLGEDSLVVRQLVFFVDSATLILDKDKRPISFSELSEGDLVEIKATIRLDGTLLALRIELEDELKNEIEIEGPIEEIRQDTIIVLQKKILVDSRTKIRGKEERELSLADLEVGQFVKIKGEVLSDGTILALRIKVKDKFPQANELEIEGIIDSVGVDFLVVNGITIFVDAQTEIRGPHKTSLSFDALLPGMRVEIKAQIQADGKFLALKIKVEDKVENEIEITALIDTLFGDTLVVAGIPFWTDTSTVLLDQSRLPISLADLEIGMIVKVEGIKIPDGSYYAARIKVKDFWRAELEIKGTIESLTDSSLTVNGIEFFYNDSTQFLDEDKQSLDPASLSTGQLVEVKAIHRADGTFLAVRVKLEKSPNGLTVEGIVNTLNASGVEIGGVVMQVDQSSIILDQANRPITLSDLPTGVWVTAKALAQLNGTYSIDEIRTEGDPGILKISGIVLLITLETIVVSDPTFQVTPSTIVLNERYLPMDYGNISVGQEVTIWTENSSTGIFSALQIKLNPQGSITSLNTADEISHIPRNFRLLQNYPNPFNPETHIPFEIPGVRWYRVELTIYNILGQRVRTLFNGVLQGGRHEFVWDGRNRRGFAMPSGVYFYQLRVSDRFVETRRMVLIR